MVFIHKSQVIIVGINCSTEILRLLSSDIRHGGFLPLPF